MFRSARIKLTAWYLLIIMLVSMSFSVAMYRIISSELDRVERVQRLRIERGFPQRIIIPPQDNGTLAPRIFILDPDIVAETKYRLIAELVVINLTIMGASAIAGYFLAGRTLKPIAEMVAEQNRFVTDASHELRTPLTSLKSEIEVNLRDKKLTLTGAKDLLKSNLEEVNNLQILSDGLIKLTQYQQGVNGLTYAKTPLKTIIDEAVRKVAPLAKSKEIGIVNKITDYEMVVNKSAMTELFVIFLDNAIKYSLTKTKVYLTSEKSDGSVLVKIRDQGIGIPEADIPHLFDRFYRTDKSRTKTDVAGYGLGLAIARQIIDEHHGTIRVQSKLNEGSIFTVQIPVSKGIPVGLILS